MDDKSGLSALQGVVPADGDVVAQVMVWSGKDPTPGDEQVLDRVTVPPLPSQGSQLMLRIGGDQPRLSIVDIAELDNAIAAALGER